MAIPAGVLVLSLLVLAQPRPGSATPLEQVAAGQKAAGLLDATQARLHSRAYALGRAVSAALEAEAQTSQPWAEAARDIVQREAAYLAAEDDLAASLLYNFARGPLPPLAAAAASNGQAPPPVGRSAQPPLGSALQTIESTEMVLQRDGASGQLARSTRYCRDGACVMRSDAVAPGEDDLVWDDPDSSAVEDVQRAEWPSLSMQHEKAWIGLSGAGQEEVEQDLSAQSADTLVLDGPQLIADQKDEGDVDPLDTAVASAVDNAGSAVREAARVMARDMKVAAETFGLAPVLNVMGLMLRGKAPRALLSDSGVVDAAARTELDSTWRSFVKNFFPDIAVKQLRAGAGENAASFLDLPFEVGPSSRVLAAESMSISMGSEDGQTVRYTRHCKNGRCETATMPVMELDATADEEDQEQQDLEEQPERQAEERPKQ